MRIAVVGGGPGGLFFALLLARTSRHSVTVFDRDPPSATYGFGVVLSRMSTARLRAYAPDVIDEITSHGVRWESVEVRAGGKVAMSHGHSFGAVGRREMLSVLRKHALAARVQIFQPWHIASASALSGYDVVVVADGAASRIREGMADHFQPSVRCGSSRYAWFGATRAFEGMTFLFAEGPHGPMGAHVYPYSKTASTFLVEAPEQVWSHAGLADDACRPPGWSDERVLNYCQAVFASELGGASLVANGSRLLRFPEVRNQRWSTPGVVLLGDAAHTAHFSVGSGTSMAMEDAAELASCLSRFARLPDAFRAYEAARRPVTESVQAAAWASSQLWERLEREAGRDVSQIMLRLLTRTGQSDMELLCRVDPRLRASLEPEHVERPAADPTAAVLLSEREGAPGDRPFAVLVRHNQLDALDSKPPAGSEWAALALIVDEADRGGDAVERTVAHLAQLRRCSTGTPAGVLYLAGSGASPAANFGDVSASMAALARSARLDFVAVGCRDATLATHATQMTLCEFVRTELDLPTVYACRPARLEHGRTQVAAARADHVWLIAGSP